MSKGVDGDELERMSNDGLATTVGVAVFVFVFRGLVRLAFLCLVVRR